MLVYTLPNKLAQVHMYSTAELKHKNTQVRVSLYLTHTLPSHITGPTQGLTCHDTSHDMFFFCHVLPCMTTRPIPGKNIQDYYPPINLSVTDIKPNQFGVIDSVLPDLSYWSVLVVKPSDQDLNRFCRVSFVLFSYSVDGFVDVSFLKIHVHNKL